MKDKALHVRAKDMLTRYVDSLGNKELTREEAELVLAIHEVASPKIVKIGDVKAGLVCSRKKFERFVSLMESVANKDFRFVVWDDLIDIVNMEGASVMEIPEDSE